MSINPPTSAQRQSLLRDPAAISTMQRGTLAEEYREQPAPHGKGTPRLGALASSSSAGRTLAI